MKSINKNRSTLNNINRLFDIDIGSDLEKQTYCIPALNQTDDLLRKNAQFQASQFTVTSNADYRAKASR